MRINHRPHRCMLYYLLAPVILACTTMTLSAAIVDHRISNNKATPVTLAGETEVHVPETVLVADSGF